MFLLVLFIVCIFIMFGFNQHLLFLNEEFIIFFGMFIFFTIIINVLRKKITRFFYSDVTLYHFKLAYLTRLNMVLASRLISLLNSLQLRREYYNTSQFLYALLKVHTCFLHLIKLRYSLTANQIIHLILINFNFLSWQFRTFTTELRIKNSKIKNPKFDFVYLNILYVKRLHKTFFKLIC